MVTGRRSQIEIINDILNISKEGAKKTDILYKGNFSYKLLQDYISFMKEKKMIEEVYVKDNGNSCRLFKPTHKGLVFLEESNNLLEKFIY